jgi:hypothetical protein
MQKGVIMLERLTHIIPEWLLLVLLGKALGTLFFLS